MAEIDKPENQSAPAPQAEKTHKRPRLPYISGGIVVALALLALFWNWNWFKPYVEKEASETLGREVKIGNIDLHLFRRNPVFEIDDMTVANPTGFKPDSRFGSVGKLAVAVEPAGLFHHQVNLTSVEIDDPKGDLGPGPDGKPNWLFPALMKPAADPSQPPSPWSTNIGGLVVKGGDIHIVDPKLKADFVVHVDTQAPTKPGGEDHIVVTAKGTYSGQPVDARFVGGAVLTLRDGKKPYPIDLRVNNGATSVTMTGTVSDPAHFAGANLDLVLHGPDMALLTPLIGVPLAPTPPYNIKGKLDYTSDNRIRFRDFSGTVGQSDIEGTIAVDPGKERPKMTAELTSKRIVMADLGGFVGAAPGKDDQPGQTAQQKQQRAEKKASHNLFPDTPINLPKIRQADFDIRYKAEHIVDKNMPIDNLSTHMIIAGGEITLKPLSFGVGKGQIVTNIALDGRSSVIKTTADADFRQVDLTRIMQSTGVFHGAGTIGGHADIVTTGNSLAAMLGNGNGSVHLFMTGGNLSAVLVDLAGLQFGSSILSMIGIPSNADIRCMISNFDLNDGDLQTKLLLLDTTEANVVGKGAIHLKPETIDYQLTTDPKHFTIGSLPAPIDINGDLKSPSIKPDPGTLAARGGAAVVLGVLLTPVAALIPTIDLGLGKDTNCADTVRQVQTAADQSAAVTNHRINRVSHRAAVKAGVKPLPRHATEAAQPKSELPRATPKSQTP